MVQIIVSDGSPRIDFPSSFRTYQYSNAVVNYLLYEGQPLASFEIVSWSRLFPLLRTDQDFFSAVPKIVPAWIKESDGTCLPGKMITEAPTAQLLPTTAPKWSVPVSTRSFPTAYLILPLVSNTFAVPEYPPNQTFSPRQYTK